MSTDQLRLASPPSKPRALELWIQHAAGRILFEDVRGYARERIDPTLSAEARAHVEKGIDDAMYGLMMVIDGVDGCLKNDEHEVTIRVTARLRERSEPYRVLTQIDLFEGDGMCMGYHGWREGDFGTDPVVAP